jgi:WD40 repeat protein
MKTVKLWDIETGHDIFEFTNAHDDQAITCMTFDDTGRRLITGGRDGTCKSNKTFIHVYFMFYRHLILLAFSNLFLLSYSF